ncbi:MAG: hypothetical protein ACYTEK_15665 [Planctomycetota bacterium]|jgi:ABC-type uncharacterized transport system permease subunit
MELLLFISHGWFVMPVLIAVFLIVLAVTFEALKQMSMFGQRTTFMVAVCVSLLSILGLARFTTVSQVASQTTHDGHGLHVNLDFILLPYAALALAVILTLLLRWIAGRFREQQTKKPEKTIRRRLR